MNKVKNDGLESFGVILKVKKNSVIVMTDKLDFVELNRKPDMLRGQKIYFTSLDLCNSSLWLLNSKKFLKFASAAASVAAVFAILFFGFRFLFLSNEYAYIDLDINPSIEITINRNENVLKAEALNNDGQILLDAVKIKNMDLKDAVSLLLNKSREIGFIDSFNNKVILAAALNSSKVSESQNKNINSMISSLKQIAEKSGVESQVIQLSYKDRKEAMENGLSMGKYYIYTKAKDEGIQITVEEVKNSNISTLLSKIDLSENTNDPQNPSADIEPTPEPIVQPSSSQMVASIPSVAAPTATDKTSHTFKPVATPEPSFISEHTPSPAATMVTEVVEPSITPDRAIITPHRTYYITSTPKPVFSTTPTPSPRPTVNVTVTYRPSPVVTPTKTPTPRVIITNSPTFKPISTKFSTPTTKKTPTPSVYTATPKITVIPSSKPSTPTSNPTPIISSKPTPISTLTFTPTPKITSTPIITTAPTPIITPSPTPKPTTAPTSTPIEQTSVKLGMYNEVRTDKAKEIHPRFKLINTGNTPIKLSTVKIRYYYTIDIEDKQQVFYCDWSNIGRNSITGKLVKMNTGRNDADHYLEIGFDTDESLEPGSNIEIICRIGPDNTIGDGNIFYNQLNDYSFNNSAGNFVNWDKVTVYISGNLVWGTEP
ncbi:anti-sigma-I factor RsgI family protein [Acetivibrio clariflavus]|uniref:Cellulose binding domain-containing protein n=1 Tax=Acetivibrio clariflavus (strain DSM 19732 / NBRC 101661 / EBR45) TaxID=720554 RepID=G8LXL9_ACECE|nr:cellulose binding domain-containing protein [Acetivibrio clariflavus]AEV67730.1 Cellulose binding domain-containing protein [Acetivibrio clariflavus DSM 19732]